MVARRIAQSLPRGRLGISAETALVNLRNHGPRNVTYQNVDGRAIFEGDIVLGRVADLRLSSSIIQPVATASSDAVALFSVAVSNPRLLWTNATVPVILESVADHANHIIDALDHWQALTPLRFVEISERDGRNFDGHVKFVDGPECASEVGMVGGQQLVTLDAVCEFGNIVHELGHVAGLWHEQSRADRDGFVEVLWENIFADMENNFDQQITDGDDIGPYDYDSIMHYPRDAFSWNGLPTLLPRTTGVEIGQRGGLSDGDIAAIRHLYPQSDNSTPDAGVLFRATLAAGETRVWFTYDWPSTWFVVWRVLPATVSFGELPQVQWTIQTSCEPNLSVRYHIEVRNLESRSIEVEASYLILSRDG